MLVSSNNGFKFRISYIFILSYLNLQILYLFFFFFSFFLSFHVVIVIIGNEIFEL